MLLVFFLTSTTKKYFSRYISGGYTYFFSLECFIQRISITGIKGHYYMALACG